MRGVIALAEPCEEGVEIGVADAVALGLHLAEVDAEIPGAVADGGRGEDVLLPVLRR